MTPHSDPIPTNEQLQQQVIDCQKRLDKTDMILSVMVHEIKRLRQRESQSYSQT